MREGRMEKQIGSKPDQMVTRNLDIKTIISGIVPSGGDTERQPRNYGQ